MKKLVKTYIALQFLLMASLVIAQYGDNINSTFAILSSAFLFGLCVTINVSVIAKVWKK